MPGYEAVIWLGVIAPKNTPRGDRQPPQRGDHEDRGAIRKSRAEWAQARRHADDDDADEFTRFLDRRHRQVGAHREDLRREAGPVSSGRHVGIAVRTRACARVAMIDLRILCAGAAQGLVTALQPTLIAETGAGVQGDLRRGRRDEGEAPRRRALRRHRAHRRDDRRARGAAGTCERDTIAPLGRVATGIAVRAGESLPDIADGAALARGAARGNGHPTFPIPRAPRRASISSNVLKRLGIYARSRGAAAPRFPTARPRCASSRNRARPGSIGCTQITEIRYTPGVTLAGALPGDYALSTVYSVAVCTEGRAAGDRAPASPQLLAGPALAGAARGGRIRDAESRRPRVRRPRVSRAAGFSRT